MEFKTEIFSQFDKKWALLTAGSAKSFNTMTVSWGGMGTLWGKPVVTVYVRPNRFTYGFMEENGFFTLSFYPEEYRKDLAVLGKLSGRDCDKLAETSLTPAFLAEGVTFNEAETTLVLKKLYAQDLDTAAIPPEIRERVYGDGRPHRMYIGEVVDIIAGSMRG